MDNALSMQYIYIYKELVTTCFLNKHLAKLISILIIQNTLTISSSSSCLAASTDIPDPLSPLLPIIHRFWQVFRVTSRILTQLLHVYSSWSSCFCLAICGGPQEYINDEFVLASPAVSYVHLTCIVFVMGGKWPYSGCLVGCCHQDLFNIALNILM